MLNGHNYHSSITLFERLGVLAHGFRQDQVADAAVNLVINAIVQAHRTQADAERAWDLLMHGAKQHLIIDCYDGTGGAKKTYPYYQLVRAP